MKGDLVGNCTRCGHEVFDGARHVCPHSREESAKLVESMIHQAPWKDHLWARGALAIAARAIRRCRLLSDREKLENLAASVAEGEAV